MGKEKKIELIIEGEPANGPETMYYYVIIEPEGCYYQIC